MSEKVIGALKSLGYQVEKLEDFNEEQFNAAFHKSFISRDKVDKDEDLVRGIVGKRMGSLEVAVKRAFGLKDADIAGKKLEEVFDLAATNYTSQISDLNTKIETAGKGKGDAEALKKIEDLTKMKEQLEGKLNAVAGEYETFKTESANKLKATTLNTAYAGALSKVNWAETYTGSDIVKNGFDATVRNKYEFETAEDGAIVVKDKATGKQIDHPKDKSKFASLQDVIEMEAVNNKLVKMNNAKQPIVLNKQIEQRTNTRSVHPNAAKKAAEMGIS